MGTEDRAQTLGAPARKVWVVNETHASNPRLAEILSSLSDALHMQLELVDWEERISRYDGDIPANDQNSDVAIVIEHRSDETSHYQLVPSPPDIGTSIRNRLDSGASYNEDVAEYACTQVQSRINRISEEQAE